MSQNYWRRCFIFFFFKKKIIIKNKKYYFYLDMQYFLNAIITFVIFLLLWKFYIKIFSGHIISLWAINRIYIYILVVIYIIYLINLFYKKKGKASFFKNILNLLSLFSNIIIFVYILKLNILIILYYDLFLYLYIYMLFMFNINVYLLLWKGYFDFVTDFMLYPWILLLFCYIILYFKIEKYFWFFKYTEMYFRIETEELEIREEIW